MSWEPDTGTEWKDGDSPSWKPDIDHEDDSACRNCGQLGHFARECSEPKKLTGECFNCGQVGHNKAECPNQKVHLPFTGICRLCKKEGHPARDCPEKPVSYCKLCGKEGHRQSECTGSRIMRFDVEHMETEMAWEKMVETDKIKDIDGFRNALKSYSLQTPVDLSDLENGLRAMSGNIYLIAVEKWIPDTMTIVDFKGNSDRKYVLSLQLGPECPRPRMAPSWPKSPEENLERLKDCGLVLESGKLKCHRCGEFGHSIKYCKEERVENEDRPKVQCINCKAIGHRVRDCPEPRFNPNLCKNCGNEGHKASDCTEPRSATNVECRKCNQMGHFSKDCPNVTDGRTCRNCGEEGHIAKECEKPRDPSTVTCRNCEEQGHFSRECPKPRDYSKVQCQNCQEFGHTRVRCKKMATETDFGGDNSFGNAQDFSASGNIWTKDDTKQEDNDNAWGGDAEGASGAW